MKRLIHLSLTGFLTFACAVLMAPAGAVAQQTGSNPATLTLKQVKQQLKQNKKYLKDAKKRAKAGDAQGLNTALNNYNRSMEDLNTAISHGGIQGTPSQQQDAYDTVASATKKHEGVLESLISSGKVTNPKAIAAIEHAEKISMTGHDTALSHLTQLQTQQQASGLGNRPGFGQAGGMGRSQGMGHAGGMGNMGGGVPSMGSAGMGHAGGPPAGVGGGRGR